MEISPCFTLIQRRESGACNIKCFMERNGNSFEGNKYAGLVFCIYATFSNKKCEKCDGKYWYGDC